MGGDEDNNVLRMFWNCWGGKYNIISKEFEPVYLNHIKRGKVILSDVRYLMKVLWKLAQDYNMSVGNGELSGMELSIHCRSYRAPTISNICEEILNPQVTPIKENMILSNLPSRFLSKPPKLQKIIVIFISAAVFSCLR